MSSTGFFWVKSITFFGVMRFVYELDGNLKVVKKCPATALDEPAVVACGSKMGVPVTTQLSSFVLGGKAFGLAINDGPANHPIIAAMNRETKLQCG